MNWKHVLIGAVAWALGFFLILETAADDHPKPESKIEFGIEKHGGLHFVNGGFNEYKIVKAEKVVAGYKDLRVNININSLWTHQADASRSDDPRRTADLLGKDWFYAKKFPYAYASFPFLPLNNAKEVRFTLNIRGISKVIVGKVKDGKLLFTVKLKDFNLNDSWKSIFAGNYANVVVKLVRKT